MQQVSSSLYILLCCVRVQLIIPLESSSKLTLRESPRKPGRDDDTTPWKSPKLHFNQFNITYTANTANIASITNYSPLF